MSQTQPAVAVANPNIALIKYWGKQDEALILPATGSLSLTLDAYPTQTMVELISDPVDEFYLNGEPQPLTEDQSVTKFLDLVRKRANSDTRARVVSVNAGPTAAGLASSASGYAALALAASTAYGLALSPQELSRLARRGSGSASRSIFGGLAVWHAGSDADSFAEPVQSELQLALTIAEVSKKQKSISSRKAMQLTVDTSPYFSAWVTANAADLNEMQLALKAADFSRVGELTEQSFYRMHATMLAASPAIRYLTAESVALLERVRELRIAGIEAYATMDAGPNVKVLSLATDRQAVREGLAEVVSDDKLVSALPGLGVRLHGATEVWANPTL